MGFSAAVAVDSFPARISRTKVLQDSSTTARPVTHLILTAPSSQVQVQLAIFVSL